MGGNRDQDNADEHPRLNKARNQSPSKVRASHACRPRSSMRVRPDGLAPQSLPSLDRSTSPRDVEMHTQLNCSQQPRAYWLRERQPEPINAQHPSAYLECGGRGAVRVRARLCSRDGEDGSGGGGFET